METIIHSPQNSTSFKKEYIISTSINDLAILTPQTETDEANTTSSSFQYSTSTESEAERVVPIMSREKLMEILKQFEQKYCIRSQEFYENWLAGKAPNTIDTMKWAVLWEAWRAHYLI